MSQNLLDNFEDAPQPWYDKFVKAILTVPSASRVGMILLSVIGSVATIAYKSNKGIDIESLVSVPIGFLFLLTVGGGILQFFFLLLSFIFEKITGRPNIIYQLDLGCSIFILAVATLLCILFFAFLS